jgi:hypothetical protein
VGDDPTAEADRRRAEAKDAACTAVGRAVESIGEVLAILDHRGKKSRDEGMGTLRALRDDLAAVDGRLRRAQ